MQTIHFEEYKKYYEGVTDEDVVRMQVAVDKLDLPENMRRNCIFYGGSCSAPHVVTVPAIPLCRKLETHYDLDIFAWLPAIAGPQIGFWDMAKCRYRMVHRVSGEPSQDVVFTVIYFWWQDEDRPDYYSSWQDRNHLLENSLPVDESVLKLRPGLVSESCVAWHGDLLVVKSTPNGELVNASKADIPIVTGLLSQAILAGNLA
ncbi:hypothetical protein CPC08DRAFT_727597 [Agrocybe pediades]|nr:hypothetical protein CPC08DRAFT_727597 [Agrocybe pediades]